MGSTAVSNDAVSPQGFGHLRRRQCSSARIYKLLTVSVYGLY